MAKNSLIVLGARGLVGRAWVEMLERRGEAFIAAGRDQVDIADAASVAAIIVEGTERVINCAAWANVDGAEAQETEATRINGEAVGILAARCKEVGATLIHYGTDYIFDGQGTSPYSVNHEQAPINAYGRGKALGEKLLKGSGVDHLLIRTSWVYAPWGKNFVRTMARLCIDKSLLQVVSDQRGRPTSAEQLAEQSWALLDRGARGTVHVTDGGACSWYELAQHVVSLAVPRNIESGLSAAEHQCEVRPCTSEQYPTPAVRPQSSVLCLADTQAIIGEPVHWQKAVEDVVARLE